MAPHDHRVRRQSWHLRVGSAGAAFALRARFRSQVEGLLPAFNHVFDAWAPGEAVVRIPRLELKLRVRSLDELAGALGDALRCEIPPAPAAQAVATEPGLELLVRYLRTGTLDWHAAHAEAAEIIRLLQTILVEDLQDALEAAPAGAEAFEHAMQYYFRLLQLLPKDLWHELSASTALASVPRRSEGEAAGQAGTTVRSVSGPAETGLAAAIGSIEFARARLGERPALALVAAVLAAQRTGAPSPEQLAEAVARAIGAVRFADLPAPAAQFLVTRSAGSAPEARTSTEPADPAHTLQSRETPHQRASSQTLALIAGNAGLVLLHPFLPKLFEACGLYEARGGLARDSLPRAAGLLHWLATGRDEAHEFELGAIKLLLGLRPETSLSPGADCIGEREHDEGAGLLNAAIGHWKALRGTSVDGLRVSFLQRRGALREEEAGWRLQLETESFDMLLKHLPWGIATVKLPWMTRPLFTDWPTP